MYFISVCSTGFCFICSKTMLLECECYSSASPNFLANAMFLKRKASCNAASNVRNLVNHLVQFIQEISHFVGFMLSR
jgi:hypothetical protein